MLLKASPSGFRLFYGWPMLLGLAVAETISWGVLYYSFSIFILPIESELGWSRAQVTGAFSLALLVSGLTAVPVGHWLDSRGARGLMTTGAVLGSVLLFAFSQTRSLLVLYAVWIGLGATMAMVLYEPAFAVVATWFDRHRDRALTVLTVFGGLASTLVVPLAACLLERQGWRGAVATLALVLALTTVPLHGLLLRRDPEAVGQRPDGDPAADGERRPEPSAETISLGPVMAEGRFWGLTAAFSLVSLVTVAASVHLIPHLTGRGYSSAAAAAALGAIGLMQLPGRLAFGPVRRLTSWQWNAAGVFIVQAAAVALLGTATSPFGLAVFVVLFGMSNGMCTLLRATILAELYGARRYGRVSGILSLFSTLGRAIGPVAASVAYMAWGSYTAAFAIMAGALVAAAVLVVVPWRLPSALDDPVAASVR